MTTTSLETLCRQVEQESAAATAGPWETDHERNEDHESYYVSDAEGKRICDTLNSEAELQFESPQSPEDCEYVWDDRGKRNMAFIATTRDFAPKAATELPKMARLIRRLIDQAHEHSWAHITNAECGCKRCTIAEAEQALAQFEQPKENA